MLLRIAKSSKSLMSANVGLFCRGSAAAALQEQDRACTGVLSKDTGEG